MSDEKTKSGEQPAVPGVAALAPSTASAEAPAAPAAPVPISPLPPTPNPYKQPSARFAKIQVENYRAFRGRFELDLPDGCNLLVYGENGAGKSSLFNALSDFFENPERSLKIEEHRHAYNADPVAIRLSLLHPPAADGTATAAQVYEWSAARNDSRSPEMRTVNKGKGFLDYKSLLRVHQLPRNQREVNLFDILIDPLLALYKNPVTNQAFGEEWTEIRGPFRPYVWKPDWLDESLRQFNAGFERVVRDSVAFASKLLTDFDKELALDVEFTAATYTWRPKKLISPKVIAQPSFRRLRPANYYQFLNEARLSALAIAIYFSALKQSPAPGLRLLLLDDILIGLDMVNRMAVLGMIEKLFPDWQVIILTYHKAWFEVLKARTNAGDWPNPWRSVGLRMRKAAGIEFPIVVASPESLLDQARAHFALEGNLMPDIKAAAVYARTAFEALMSWYCEEMRLRVTYTESRRELDTNDFLRSIEEHMLTLRNAKDRELAHAVLKEIKYARHFVLNPHSHFNPESEDEITAEIANGIRAVEDLNLLLRCLRREDFAKPGEKPARASVGDLAHLAMELATAGKKAAALDALARAFAQHLDEWFEMRGELLPCGRKATPHTLVALAGERQLFSKLAYTRVKHFKDYLLSEIHPHKFQLALFEAAVRLLVRLRLAFCLRLPQSHRNHATP